MNKPRIHYLALQVTGSCNVSLSLSPHLEGQWHLGMTQTAHRNDQPIVSWEAKLAERQIKCPE